MEPDSWKWCWRTWIFPLLLWSILGHAEVVELLFWSCREDTTEPSILRNSRPADCKGPSPLLLGHFHHSYDTTYNDKIPWKMHCWAFWLIVGISQLMWKLLVAIINGFKFVWWVRTMLLALKLLLDPGSTRSTVWGSAPGYTAQIILTSAGFPTDNARAKE